MLVDYNPKIFTLAVVVVLALGVLVNPAFAASSLHFSVSANEASVESKSSGWFFEESNFNSFFKSFFSTRLEAALSGEQEVPEPGDVDGVGEAKVKIKTGDSELCVDLEVEYIDQATAAHIHHAPKGSSGAVVINLPIPDAEGRADGCVIADSQLLEKIIDNPQDYYINIHNNPYPNGAIRGQLSQ